MQNRNDAIESMVLSASGWRAVFGGDDSSLARSITPVHRDLVTVAAYSFVQSIRSAKQDHSRKIVVVVGTDTRPTGPAIADTALRTFIASDCDVRWLGISAAPEIMAYTKMTDQCDAFFYISASHNPPGHNGLKMGLADGSVISQSIANPLIDRFKELAVNDQFVEGLLSKVSAVPASIMDSVYQGAKRWKQAAVETYKSFAMHVGASPLNAPNSMSVDEFRDSIKKELRRRPLGIVGELNGSARSESIDKHLLTELGVKTAIHNDVPGVFSHQILPEGPGLSEAQRLLDRYHQLDEAFQIAYVPDNDGDRGNLVFFDPASQSSIALDAQSVFALVVTIQLAWLRHLGVSESKRAVVANGPTSLRIDRICAGFGATLFRSEVGEANVVSLADKLTRDGWIVAVLGEGSNGGNITPPATVRDPMSTLLALIKMHAFGLGEYVDDSLNKESGFLDLLRRIPAFSTIATDDERAKLHIPPVSHAELKRAYEEHIDTSIEPLLDRLSTEYAVPVVYRIVNYEGIETKDGAGNRSVVARGGLKVIFSAPDGSDLASVWMRGSGTEPVFRVLADCYGTNETLLDELIQWQREAVTRASRRSS